MTDDTAVTRIERTMLAMRRSQTRRSLMKLALNRPDGQPIDSTTFDVCDLVDAAREAGEPVGVREIALGLNVDQPRASKLVSAAVTAGYLRREADQSDGRRALLAVTETGHATLDRAHAFRRDIVARATADWTAADRAAFADLFDRFVRAVAAERDTPR